jgi:hypothetical protein
MWAKKKQEPVHTKLPTKLEKIEERNNALAIQKAKTELQRDAEKFREITTLDNFPTIKPIKTKGKRKGNPGKWSEERRRTHSETMKTFWALRALEKGENPSFHGKKEGGKNGI